MVAGKPGYRKKVLSWAVKTVNKNTTTNSHREFQTIEAATVKLREPNVSSDQRYCYIERHKMAAAPEPTLSSPYLTSDVRIVFFHFESNRIVIVGLKSHQ